MAGFLHSNRSIRYPELLRIKITGRKPRRPNWLTSCAESWWEPSPVTSTTRRFGAATAAPKAAAVAQPIEPHSVWLWKDAPAGIGAKPRPIEAVPLSATRMSLGLRKFAHRG